MNLRPERPAEDDLAGLLDIAGLLGPAGDEAMLPAGSRLCDGTRPGHQCFLILDGAAEVHRAGSGPVRLERGAFVGEFGPDGRPQPAPGVTVRLLVSSRVLVLDSARLAALIDAEPALAAWRAVVRGVTS